MKAEKIRSSSGFTLLEMLVSITLLLMLSGILFEVFTKANQVSRKSEAWIEIHQNARCMFDFLERDLSGAILVGKTTTAGDESGRYFELYDENGAVGDDAGVVHDHDSVRFVSRTGARYGSIAEVGYYLTIDVSSSRDDMRKNELGRYYDDAGQGGGDDLDVIAGADVWVAYESMDVVAKGVTDFKIEYWDGTTWQGIPSAWADFGALDPPLPKLLRITAHITDSKGIFLTGNTDSSPFCGKGLKFVHVVIAGRN